MFIGDKEIKIKDFIDNGDSYNYGPEANDYGQEGKILNSKILYKGETRSILWLEVELGDIFNIQISLDKYSPMLNFLIEWENTKKNHQLQFVINTNDKIETTYSEDMGNIIERHFDSSYDIRKNLPKERGIEAKSNNAPMQRGVFTNGIGIITKGITQYEIFHNEIRIPLLRATGLISNKDNTSRSTPAGPPIEVNDLQQLGKNSVQFNIFIGNKSELKNNIKNTYNECIVL